MHARNDWYSLYGSVVIFLIVDEISLSDIEHWNLTFFPNSFQSAFIQFPFYCYFASGKPMFIRFSKPNNVTFLSSQMNGNGRNGMYQISCMKNWKCQTFRFPWRSFRRFLRTVVLLTRRWRRFFWSIRLFRNSSVLQKLFRNILLSVSLSELSAAKVRSVCVHISQTDVFGEACNNFVV